MTDEIDPIWPEDLVSIVEDRTDEAGRPLDMLRYVSMRIRTRMIVGACV
jgi:hypothetical protein